MAHAATIAIYLLCIVTSVSCCILLARGFMRDGTRLLLWTAICFAFLTVHAITVMIELIIFPSVDLQMFRHTASLAAAGTLLFGLVWETE